MIKPLPKKTPTSLRPLDWAWPSAAASMTIHDKYCGKDIVVSRGQHEWVLSVGGYMRTLKFSEHPGSRDLQQVLIILTQSAGSPASIAKFGARLIKDWALFDELLKAGPDSLKKLWKARVTDVEVSRAGKTVLKLACRSAVGLWRPRHLPLIKALSAHAREVIKDQQAKISRREKLVPIETQAMVTNVLNEASPSDDLSDDALEGLVGGALTFQHGMRPVQLIAVDVEHVLVTSEFSGDVTCIVSFHSAKRKNGKKVIEMPRSVKSEWAWLVIELKQRALGAGRSRLFSQTTASTLWSRVRAAFGIHRSDRSFMPGHFRHAAAQSLADAGHSQSSIMKFLGHDKEDTAKIYIEASPRQAQLINKALGASRLYSKITAMANGEFVSLAEMLNAPDEQQIGAVVGDRLVAGIGLCRSGQPTCPHNPVTSCYGCSKFIPSRIRDAHVEAIAGMRAEISKFIDVEAGNISPAALQLTRALSVAQQAVSMADACEGAKA